MTDMHEVRVPAAQLRAAAAEIAIECPIVRTEVTNSDNYSPNARKRMDIRSTPGTKVLWDLRVVVEDVELDLDEYMFRSIPRHCTTRKAIEAAIPELIAEVREQAVYDYDDWFTWGEARNFGPSPICAAVLAKLAEVTA